MFFPTTIPPTYRQEAHLHIRTRCSLLNTFITMRYIPLFSSLFITNNLLFCKIIAIQVCLTFQVLSNSLLPLHIQTSTSFHLQYIATFHPFTSCISYLFVLFIDKHASVHCLATKKFAG